MLTAQGDLAALVYDEHQDPDALLRDFAADLTARGLRPVGMGQAGQCAESSLSAVLLPSGEKLLLDEKQAAQIRDSSLGRCLILQPQSRRPFRRDGATHGGGKPEGDVV